MMHKRLKICLLLMLIGILGACSNPETKPNAPKEKTVELTISAAASLKDALTQIQRTYEKEHKNIELHYNFGASGTLQQQISQGAPVDLFFSAAEDKFDALVDEGMISKKNGTDLVGNELVLVVPKGSENRVNNLDDLAKIDVKKISIGTPDAVPAGQYAKEAFEKTKTWSKVESKIVYAKDVRQVLSYVETGNVDAGLVYKTDALISKKAEIAATVDPNTHSPIIYPVGIIKNTKHSKEAKEYYQFLQSKQAIKILEDYGFKKI